jgi:hypothetical protein
MRSACGNDRSSSAEGIPSSSSTVEGTTATPDPSATASASTTDADIADQRDRLQRQLLVRNVAVQFLNDDAETLRGDSLIDGMSLDERLEPLGSEFTLAPGDDVYTAGGATLGMGRPICDGSSVDPRYTDVEVWAMRRTSHGHSSATTPRSRRESVRGYGLVDPGRVPRRR